MRAVLDTNIFVSGMLGLHPSESTPGEVLRCWRRDRFIRIASLPIVREIERTLAEPYFRQHIAAHDLAATLELLYRNAEHVVLKTVVEGVVSHPEDDLILATAVNGRADFLITGDKQLLLIPIFKGFQIIEARDFLKLLEAT